MSPTARASSPYYVWCLLQTRKTMQCCNIFWLVRNIIRTKGSKASVRVRACVRIPQEQSKGRGKAKKPSFCCAQLLPQLRTAHVSCLLHLFSDAHEFWKPLPLLLLLLNLPELTLTPCRGWFGLRRLFAVY